MRIIDTTKQDKEPKLFVKPSGFEIATVDDEERRASKLLVYATALVLIVFIAWSSFFSLDEVTTGQGKIIPASREQVIQSLDSGILEEMLVKPGETVEKGQVLLRIDDSRTGPVYREAREKWIALMGLEARLRAEAYNLPLEFPAEVKAVPGIVNRETQAYRARKKALEEQIEPMKRSLVLIGREIKLTSPMVKEGVMSEVDLMHLQRSEADLSAQIAERRNRYFTDANNELVRVAADMAQARESALGREDAFKRSVIRSPMRGIVKSIQLTTIGGVVQAGQDLMDIIPVDDQMLVDAYIKPADIAFVKVGQPAVIKLTSYDFNRYGALTGEVVDVSPDTMRDESKPRKPGSSPVELDEGYYRVIVKVTDTNLVRKGRELTLTPGMTATVDITTGRKTVIEYLLRPVQSLTQAFRER